MVAAIASEEVKRVYKWCGDATEAERFKANGRAQRPGRENSEEAILRELFRSPKSKSGNNKAETHVWRTPWRE